MITTPFCGWWSGLSICESWNFSSLWKQNTSRRSLCESFYAHVNNFQNQKSSGASLTLQERLKRKRQALLNKQCKFLRWCLIWNHSTVFLNPVKADKIAEQLKTEREKQEQQNREDELREMAIKLRRRYLNHHSVQCVCSVDWLFIGKERFVTHTTVTVRDLRTLKKRSAVLRLWKAIKDQWAGARVRNQNSLKGRAAEKDEIRRAVTS